MKYYNFIIKFIIYIRFYLKNLFCNIDIFILKNLIKIQQILEILEILIIKLHFYNKIIYFTYITFNNINT